jgi:general secretion pathway protein G
MERSQATRRPHRPRRQRGFTLIEIMAVVVIMGLLMGIVGTAVFTQIEKARVNTTRAQIEQLEAALTFYQMDNGRFPTTEQGLQARVERPTSAPEPRSYNPAGYLKKRQVPLDGWGNPYQYAMPGTNNPESFDLWSLGADGQPGGSDTDADLGNWLEPREGA